MSFLIPLSVIFFNKFGLAQIYNPAKSDSFNCVAIIRWIKLFFKFLSYIFIYSIISLNLKHYQLFYLTSFFILGLINFSNISRDLLD